MLTSKQRRFCRFYVQNLGHPAKAAKAAGFKGSTAFLQAQGIALLERPDIKSEINALLGAARLNSNMILQHIQDIATADIGDFIDIAPNGTYSINLAKAKAGMKLGVVKGIKTTRYGVELEFYDKLSALKLLGQHEALFVTVSRTEEWRVSAIRDIQNERVTYKDLIDAFGDGDLVAQLFVEAGVPIPDTAMLPAGTEVKIEGHLVDKNDE